MDKRLLDMEEQFGYVQKSFIDLSIYLSGLDLEKDLLKQSVLVELNGQLRRTYTLFEQGLCESLPVCTKCEGNKTQLSELVDLIDTCVQNEMMSEEAFRALNDFIQVIPQILSEMKTIYLQSLSELS